MACPGLDYIHVCVLREPTISSNFLTPPSTWPLVFSHSTSTYKITTRLDGKPSIFNISKYSQQSDYTIWEADYIPERIVDLDATFSPGNNISDPASKSQFFANAINSIVGLILKYKIVYFINFPFEYYSLLEQINNEFVKKSRSHRAQ